MSMLIRSYKSVTSSGRIQRRICDRSYSDQNLCPGNLTKVGSVTRPKPTKKIKL